MHLDSPLLRVSATVGDSSVEFKLPRPDGCKATVPLTTVNRSSTLKQVIKIIFCDGAVSLAVSEGVLEAWLECLESLPEPNTPSSVLTTDEGAMVKYLKLCRQLSWGLGPQDGSNSTGSRGSTCVKAMGAKWVISGEAQCGKC